MPPSQVLECHTSRELSEWSAFLAMEPSGEERADLRAGIVSSTIANAHRQKKGKTYKPKDFMVDFNRKEQTEEEQMAAAEAMAKAFGAKKGGKKWQQSEP